MRVPSLHRKRSFASLSCNQSLLNEAGLDTPQWQQRKGSVCILFSEDVTHVYTHAHDKEDVFIPIWAVFHTVRHADRHVHAHTQNKNVWATCSAEPPNYYQLLCINKPWHKSSDESATPNTLETLPTLAQRRRTGQIGRGGRREGQGRGEKDTEGGERWGRQVIKAKGELGEREVWEDKDGGERKRNAAASVARRLVVILHCLIWACDHHSPHGTEILSPPK